MVFRDLDKRLEDFIRQKAGDLGYTVVGITGRGGKGRFVEITLDKEGGINLDECGDFNEKVRGWMEENGLEDADLTLEVCSPGLDREIKSDDEYRWAMGKDLVLHTYGPVNGSKDFRGKLSAVSSRSVEVETEDGMTVTIERPNISKAKLNVTQKRNSEKTQ